MKAKIVMHNGSSLRFVTVTVLLFTFALQVLARQLASS